MMNNIIILPIMIIQLSLFLSARADDCDDDGSHPAGNEKAALPLKIAALFSILVGGCIGIILPIFGKWIPMLSAERKLFLFLKAFGAGVILSTGFVHVLSDSYDNLSSPCIPESWQDFPFTGLVAMAAAAFTMMVETTADGYYTRARAKKGRLPVQVVEAEEVEAEHAIHVHPVHGHAHGEGDATLQLLHNRVVAKVLEVGIVAHSVIIGISLGVSANPTTIRPLLIALTFHQFFEGMGLGGCIVQAKFNLKSMIMMVAFFSLTTPVGIAVGIGISSVYKVKGTFMLLEGILNAAAAGILIYMALVDLIASDLKQPKVLKSGRIQIGLNAMFIFGAGCMAVLAKWA